MRKPECPSHSSASTSMGIGCQLAVGNWRFRGQPPTANRQPRRTALSGDTVLWDQQGPVGRITLNRPETLNAWTAEFGRALGDVITGPAADESVRAVLITGAGRGFSSGADLKAGFEANPDDGGPDVRKELELY